MLVTRLKTNHLVNPLGFDLTSPVLSWTVRDTAAKKQASARITVAADPEMKDILFDTGVRTDLKSTGYALKMELAPETRYYWQVSVTADNGDTAVSLPAWFETAKAGEWDAEWITPLADKEIQVTMFRTVEIKKPVKQARLYAVGLGVYEAMVNGEKLGEECLLPGLHDYDDWIQYQTFEVSLRQGENLIEVMLGNGWYKGVFGLAKKQENYGDKLALIGELAITYEDGTKERILTGTDWQAKRSIVAETGIYSGEKQDANYDREETFGVAPIAIDKKKLSPRLSPRIIVNERITPVEIIHTPAGETVLDMGQNMVGWLTFKGGQQKGTEIYMQFGEILQDGNFYRDNLRTAKAEFTYISDGQDRLVRPYFTFYGFRFVKVTGWPGEPKKEDFEGWVIHSEMEEIGFIETSDPLVNRLFLNARWGQKGNFLDVPTDCPQRDERYGWTGDAQIFSGTASFNTDAYAFYRKFLHDLELEQNHLNGSVPDVVPTANVKWHASTAWGDAATIIPWNVYLHSGDPEILERQFGSMKAWVDYMKGEDDRFGSRRLWQSGTHYADWLALDGKVEGGVYGATDPYLVSSAYYYYSADIVAKAAAVLGKEEEAAAYRKLADEIKAAFEEEYFTRTGRLSVDTMTAYVVVLYMNLTPDYALERVKKGLKDKLKTNGYHLETGFVGTPYLCQVLSRYGMNDIAYHLLMEKGYPGWLYEVLMGATTIWERWNSVLPNGKISGIGMNSLNHYSYGSIVEWMYRYMIGITPLEEAPGFERVRIAPKPDHVLTRARGFVDSANGRYAAGWETAKNGRVLTVMAEVPFNGEALLVLPGASAEALGEQLAGLAAVQNGEDTEVTLTAGTYTFTYRPAHPVRKVYCLDSLMSELMENPKTKAVVESYFLSVYPKIPFGDEVQSLAEVVNGPFSSLPLEMQKELDQALREVE